MVDLQILYFKLFIITFLKMSFFIHEVPIPISYFVSANGKSKNREKILIFLNEIWKIAIEKQQEDATLKKPLLKTSAIKPSQKRKHMKEIPEHFQGQWITTAEFCNLRPQNMFHRQLDTGSLPVSEPERQNRHILFRKKFTMKGAVSTVIRISGDDYYKLYINGVRVGQGLRQDTLFTIFTMKSTSPALSMPESIHWRYTPIIRDSSIAYGSAATAGTE